MSYLWLKILLVFVLTLLSGFFSGSEIAIISIRKTRISSLAKKNNRRAKIIQELQRNPEKLFATAQTGITLLTIFLSAFAGTNFEKYMAPQLEKIPVSFVYTHADAFAFVIIVLIVSYVSLLLGELVPKSIGVRYAERISLLSAYPIWWISQIFSIPVKILNSSANVILKPLKNSFGYAEAKISEEEIRTLIAEGRSAGNIEPREQEMLENVFEFSDLSVNRIMIPRARIFALDLSNSAHENIHAAIASGYSRIPFFRDVLDNIVGILYTKDLLKYFHRGEKEVNLEKLLLPPFFVPGSQKVSDVLQLLQKRHFHMALVSNEHGEVEGLITLEDIVEEIVGDISDESDERNKSFQREKDGSFIVPGEMLVVDFNKYFKSDLPEDKTFTTVSGFIFNRLERFPEAGDSIQLGSYEFTVKEKTDRSIKEVKVRKIGE